MTEGDNKESGPETPPPPPERVWLPPRLRDRLEGADAPPPKNKADIGGWIAMLVVVALGAGVVWWSGQKRAAERKAEEKRVEEARQAAVAESLAQVRMADSLKQVARADSAKAFMALPAWKQAQILGGLGEADTTAGAPSLDETGKFSIDAGSYLFEDAAQDVARTIKGARVVTVESYGNTSYHVYVGNYTQRGAAAYAADRLLEGGKVLQATVIKVEE